MSDTFDVRCQTANLRMIAILTAVTARNSDDLDLALEGLTVRDLREVVASLAGVLEAVWGETLTADQYATFLQDVALTWAAKP